MLTRSFLLHDGRFVIQSASSIEFQGNKHLTRVQLLDIFGDDVDRNIFRISLEERQAQLEQLSWVQHATVMRLLPNRIRVSVSERTPVAFVRQGNHIGLVDAGGVLLDMAPTGAPTQPDPHYSFPVITGISAADPASTRAARMKIFGRFAADLDSSGEKVSEVLSEVDLSNPEDVKALIPDHSAGILVHFGDDHFLDRYRRFQDHLPEWHTQYPNLTSVDMRYEREVVLDMAGTAAAKVDEAAPRPAASVPAKPATKTAVTPSVKPSIKPVLKPKSKRTVKPVPHKAAAKQAAHTVPAPSRPAPKSTVQTLPPPPAGSTTPSTASAGARTGYLAKPTAGKPLSSDQYHPPQVPPR
jgi:cell division protein FtsQ